MIRTTTGYREVRREVNGVKYLAFPKASVHSDISCSVCSFGYDVDCSQCHDCVEGCKMTDTDGSVYVLAEDIIWRELE